MRSEDLRTLLSDLRANGDESFLAARPEPVLVLRQVLFTPVPGEDPLQGMVVRLVGPVVRVGRDSSNDVIAPFASISRRHATLVISNGQALVIDRGSSNGTYVGGQRLLADVPRLLRDGDEVAFGYDLQGQFLTGRALVAALRTIPMAA